MKLFTLRSFQAVTLLSFFGALASFAAPPAATEPTTADTPTTENPSPTREKWDAGKTVAQTREEIGAAWEASKDAAFRERELVRERMKAAEAMLDLKITEWGAQKAAVASTRKAEVDAAHTELREARAVLGQKIDALDNATEATWSSVKSELNTAWQRVTTATSSLAAKLKS